MIHVVDNKQTAQNKFFYFFPKANRQLIDVFEDRFLGSLPGLSTMIVMIDLYVS